MRTKKQNNEYMKAYWKKNPGKLKSLHKSQYKKHKAFYMAKSKRWKKKNPDRRRLLERERVARIRKVDHKFRLYQSFMSLMYINNGSCRNWRRILGYSLKELIDHIENQFSSDMTWENYGKYWELDHIIPRNKFRRGDLTSIDFKRCWALSNLRPLNIIENRGRNYKNL